MAFVGELAVCVLLSPFEIDKGLILTAIIEKGIRTKFFSGSIDS